MNVLHADLNIGPVLERGHDGRQCERRRKQNHGSVLRALIVREEFANSTWQAFWQTAVEGRETKDVAAALGLSAGAVYIARSRVIARLRERIEKFEAE